ncbi:hypothetical protein [Actinomadura formosensis]|uniref:hypothetical protein n=1 Tax=Actinomadura formosensis TaxID=60706 RepID=UPI00082A97D0|nr:hypothetical protein [Actinomadura formosensis]
MSGDGEAPQGGNRFDGEAQHVIQVGGLHGDLTVGAGAGCRIGAPCGVPAVGLCGACERPMCRSHQAVERNGPSFALCSKCQEDQKQALEVSRRDRRERIARARQRVVDVARHLDALDAPNEKYFHAMRRRNNLLDRFLERQGIFRTVDVDHPAGHGYGWFVGEHEWRVTLTGSGGERHSRQVRCRTFVTGSGMLAPQDAVSSDSYPVVGYDSAPLVGSWDAALDDALAFWEDVASRMNAILARIPTRQT